MAHKHERPRRDRRRTGTGSPTTGEAAQAPGADGTTRTPGAADAAATDLDDAEARAQADRADPPPAATADPAAETAETGPGATPSPRRLAWLRLRAAFTARPGRSQLLAAFLCAILGFAATTQIRQTEADGLQQLSEAELVRIMADVGQRTERLEAERDELLAQQRELASGSDQQEAAREQARARAEALAILTGEAPVEGSGIVIEVTDPGRAVTAADMVGIVQELRDAGAEAIEISGIRVVASTAITASADGGVLIGGEEAEPPYRVAAIGDPETMDTALQIPGGVRDTVERRGAAMTTERQSRLEIRATVAAGNTGP
ncbi:DUF881 domain-containing protein [Sediminivirga luteola]|uniref:DUF881 domain-containing protein n=1 Tax=Sediminivirga luteola TaxID=1774748 RepID=A0A8J2TZP7_9MICO|nr:DUF881 domain-containing protein [Sediminivirga luteola]GGA21285.1 hypothetical protein GCM10011333_25510 [Sediminivirga luteola]